MITKAWNKTKLWLATGVTAVAVGVLGVNAIPQETARAAGVVVEAHQPFGAATPTTERSRHDRSR